MCYVLNQADGVDFTQEKNAFYDFRFNAPWTGSNVFLNATKIPSAMS